MKNVKIVFPLFVAFTVIFFTACKKSDDVTTTPAPTPSPLSTYPAPVRNEISRGMIDSLSAAGAHIYDGTTPPIVNNIYYMHPDSCTYDNLSGSAGTLYSDYKFQFSAQNNTDFTIAVAQKTFPGGTLSSAPASAYISGSGNHFSIFLLRTISPSGIPVQQFNVLSGTLTSTGIQDLQNTLYMRSKGADPSNLVVPAGTIRVFINGAPGLAAVSSTF